MRPFAITLAVVFVALPLLRAEDRSPAPDVGAQAKAEKTIKDLFKEDFAKKKAADLQELAGKLIKQAAETNDDPAGKFVLLRLAQETAAKVGDAGQALQAIDAQAKDFAVNATVLKSQALDTAVRATGAQVDFQAILDAALPAADEAQAADDFDAESRLLRTAQTAAQKVGNKPMATLASERGKLVDAMQKEFVNVKADLATLKDKPEDPTAGFHVGRFLCFFKGDWDKGLPLLALSGDAKLKDLAKKDLNGPSTAADQAALADAWMDVADAETGGKPLIQLHAYGWYKQAAPQLAGLDKAKVEKKIKDLDALSDKLTVPTDKGTAEGGWFVLFRSIDPRLWDMDANFGKNNFGLSLSKAPDGVQFLKLTLMRTHDYVIIPMTNDSLKMKSDDGIIGWQGESKESWHGYHLGVFYVAIKDITKGEICVTDLGSGKGNTGWGFGHRAAVNDMQGYTWAGVPIAPSVFEIAVKTGALTDAETKRLLQKKDKDK